MTRQRETLPFPPLIINRHNLSPLSLFANLGVASQDIPHCAETRRLDASIHTPLRDDDCNNEAAQRVAICNLTFGASA